MVHGNYIERLISIYDTVEMPAEIRSAIVSQIVSIIIIVDRYVLNNRKEHRFEKDILEERRCSSLTKACIDDL
jgi:hypothetical protein